MKNRRITLLATICLAALAAVVAGQTNARVVSIEGRDSRIVVDQGTGEYRVELKNPAWVFGGGTGSPMRSARVSQGKDEIGAYAQFSFEWLPPLKMTGSIRTYRDRPIVTFSYTLRDAVTTQPPAFPNLTRIPAGLRLFSHQNDAFAIPAYGKAVETSTPWLLFDDSAQAAIISPAANFLTATMLGDGTTTIAGGLDKALQRLPKDFTHSTVLAFGPGIGKTYAVWGRYLTDLSGKKRPPNDADIGLTYLGYWTDNGAAYYYNYDADKGYARTLLAVRDEMKRLAVPIRYLQLDSWWYQKSTAGADGVDSGTPRNADLPRGTWNAYGGLLKYEAHPDLFPSGLAAFRKELGLPLITHNRWIDPKSPYHQKYRVSGVAAVDPGYWNEIADYIKSSGGITYEQDWLRELWTFSPQLHSDSALADRFMDTMSASFRDRGLTMQYCMAQPRHFLQGSRYDNLTTIRTSYDKFGRARWRDFLYVNQLAFSLGTWPWSDVFRSNETPNILLATLSAGMVGIGDRIGETSVENVLLSVRQDGVIVKPDQTIVPSDETYVSNARSNDSPVVGVARSAGAVPTLYVFGYPRSEQQREMQFKPADYGIPGEAWVYDWKAKSGRKLSAGATFAAAFDGPAPDAWSYYIMAPVQPGGIAFLGDVGKFASNGRQRIASMAASGANLIVTIAFASGEKEVTVHGYAETAPRVSVDSGKPGELIYDAATKHFTVSISPEIPPRPGQTPRATVRFSK